jgi:hypothetical protein
MSLNAIAIPAAREPGPLVTRRCPSQTVAKIDSIGLVVRRWIGDSADRLRAAMRSRPTASQVRFVSLEALAAFKRPAFAGLS